MVAKKIHQQLHRAARNKHVQAIVGLAALLVFMLLVTSSCERNERNDLVPVDSVVPSDTQLSGTAVGRVVGKPVLCNDYACAARVAQECNAANPVWMQGLTSDGLREIIAFSGWGGDVCTFSIVHQDAKGLRKQKDCSLPKAKMSDVQQIINVLESGCGNQ